MKRNVLDYEYSNSSFNTNKKKKSLDDYIEMNDSCVTSTKDGSEMILYTTNTVPYKYDICHINKLYCDILYIYEDISKNNHDTLYLFTNAIGSLLFDINYYFMNKYNEGVIDYIVLGYKHIISDMIGDIEDNKESSSYDYTNNYSISDFYTYLLATESKDNYIFTIIIINKTLATSINKQAKKLLREETTHKKVKLNQIPIEGYTLYTDPNRDVTVDLENNYTEMQYNLYNNCINDYRSSIGTTSTLLHSELLDKLNRQSKIELVDKLPKDPENGKIYMVKTINDNYSEWVWYNNTWYQIGMAPALGQTYMY